jgi:hypothetical protein
MKHTSLDEIRDEVNVVAFKLETQKSPWTIRRERLERFATVLESYEGPIRLLARVEFVPHGERMRMRTDDSPLTVAYADPDLRRRGLAGDRFGDAITFFMLNPGEAHHLLCDCHYFGSVTSQMIAARARSMAHRTSVGELWAKARALLGFR